MLTNGFAAGIIDLVFDRLFRSIIMVRMYNSYFTLSCKIKNKNRTRPSNDKFSSINARNINLLLFKTSYYAEFMLVFLKKDYFDSKGNS